MNTAMQELKQQLAASQAELKQERRLRDNLRLEFITAGPDEKARLAIKIEDGDAHIRQLEGHCDDIQREIDLLEQMPSPPQPRLPPLPSDSFTHDAFLSYVTAEPDLSWVWTELVPRIEDTGLHYIVTEEVTPPGVARVLGVEHALQQARRVVIVLTANYMAGKAPQFDNILAQTESWNQGLFRLLPIVLESIDPENPPTWLPARLNPNFVRPIDLSPAAVARGQRIAQLDPWAKLIEALRSPLPTM